MCLQTPHRSVGRHSGRRRIGGGRIRRATLTCLTVGLVMGGCQRVGVSPPAPPASLAACAVPRIETGSWRFMTDSAGVSYRIPQHFTERERDDSYREFVTAREPSGRILVGFSPSRDHYTSIRRVPSPGMMEMSECIDDVNGRQILFQAWRSRGGRFRNGRRSDLFETLALVPVEPMLTLYVSGGGASPAFQEILLAVARSVVVEDR